MSDQQLTITPKLLQRLSSLKSQLTFGPTADEMYTGVHDLGSRAVCDSTFARLIDDLVAGLPTRATKKFVLGKFRSSWKSLPICDTEDRERAVAHYELIMDALGIESSDGLLARLLYGPILGWLLRPKR